MKIIFFLVLIASQCLMTQVRSKSADLFEELESGKLTLRFYNALTGKPVPDIGVLIQTLGEFTADIEGKITFPPPGEDGVLMVRTVGDGYIPAEFPIEIMAGTLFFNRISLSPKLDIKFVRIVVDWDKDPKDLDAHFVKKGKNGYHISFRNMKVLADKSGMLDIDARTGYGPETITLNEISVSSEYEYYIHDFSNQGNPASTFLSDSKATVKVYGEGRLMQVISVPRKKAGTVWKVFTMEQGQIRVLNQVGNN